MILTFTVRFDPHVVSLNQRLHPLARGGANQHAKEAAWGAWVAAERPALAGPVRMHYHACRGRELDDDNIIAGCKAIRDELSRLVGLPNDGPRWVRNGEVTQEYGEVWAGHEQVVVTLEERPKEEFAPMRTAAATPKNRPAPKKTASAPAAAKKASQPAAYAPTRYVCQAKKRDGSICGHSLVAFVPPEGAVRCLKCSRNMAAVGPVGAKKDGGDDAN